MSMFSDGDQIENSLAQLSSGEYVRGKGRKGGKGGRKGWKEGVSE